MTQFTDEAGYPLYRKSLFAWVAEGLFLITLLAVTMFTAAFGLNQALADGDDAEDEATFMMECVYGWGQTPANCREILQGEDPAPLPEPEDGC